MKQLHDTKTVTTPGPQTKPSGPNRLLTPRDLEIHSWIDRSGAATISQVRRRFRLGRSQAYRRIGALRQHDLLRRHGVYIGISPLYAPVGKTISSATFVHTIALTDLLVDLDLEGRSAMGEIEIRRDCFGEGELLSRLSPDQIDTVRGCPRVPDVIELGTSGGAIAYEIELSSKGKARRERIFSEYATSDYERVVWLSPDPGLRRLLSREAEQMGLGDFMEVRDGRS